MPISMEEATAISDLTVFGFGFGLVFVGLICIIVICSVMGAICKKFIKKSDAVATPAAPAAQAPVQAANKGELAAAIATAIAEDLGTDVTGIRIKSIKKL